MLGITDFFGVFNVESARLIKLIFWALGCGLITLSPLNFLDNELIELCDMDDPNLLEFNLDLLLSDKIVWLLLKVFFLTIEF